MITIIPAGSRFDCAFRLAFNLAGVGPEASRGEREGSRSECNTMVYWRVALSSQWWPFSMNYLGRFL